MAGAAVDTAQQYTIEVDRPAVARRCSTELASSRYPAFACLNARVTRGKRRATSPRSRGGTSSPSLVIVTTSGTRIGQRPVCAGTPGGQ